jgi:hypothetical protein
MCLHRRIHPQHHGKQTRQVPLPNDIARTHSLNKQHRNWHPLDITSSHIHHILQIWPHQNMPCSTKWKEPLHRRKFPTCDSLETGVCNYVSSIPKDWYIATNQTLPARWQQCTDLWGEYVKSATVQLVASHKLEASKPAECKSLYIFAILKCYNTYIIYINVHDLLHIH